MGGMGKIVSLYKIKIQTWGMWIPHLFQRESTFLPKGC